MTNDLSQLQCVACRLGATKVTEQEIDTLLKDLPNWTAITSEGIRQLSCQFRFKNFAQALAFTNQVGAMAEEQGHHPALLTEWGLVTVTWWSHSIKGLHKNDFICAAKTSAIYNDSN